LIQHHTLQGLLNWEKTAPWPMTWKTTCTHVSHVSGYFLFVDFASTPQPDWVKKMLDYCVLSFAHVLKALIQMWGYIYCVYTAETGWGLIQI
jgi:hypothetical protein